jgi:geranylgeranyl diphosphate synthase type I
MTQPVALPRVRRDVDQYLQGYFARQIAASSALHPAYGSLWQALQTVSLAGGKRLRPYLMLLSYQAYGGRGYRAVLPAACALELLHISLLVHDDIIDQDYIRHGQPNVAGLFRERYAGFPGARDVAHYADAAALLGGDLLLAGAHELVAASAAAAPRKLSVLQELDRTIFTVDGGELLDTESVMQPFDQVDPLQIAALKTAYYSCIAPLKVGALLAGAGQAEFRQLECFGTALGIAYQLADDLLGVYGDEAVTGKSIISDVREGKRTFLMAAALRLAGPADLRVLQAALGNARLSPAQAARVRTIMTACGARQAAIDEAAAHVARAGRSLDKLRIRPAVKPALRALIREAVERVS